MTDAQRFPADGRGILCRHNFPPRQCPYAKCGYREALERLEKLERTDATQISDRDSEPAAYGSVDRILKERLEQCEADYKRCCELNEKLCYEVHDLKAARAAVEGK